MSQAAILKAPLPTVVDAVGPNDSFQGSAVAGWLVSLGSGWWSRLVVVILAEEGQGGQDADVDAAAAWSGGRR